MSDAIKNKDAIDLMAQKKPLVNFLQKFWSFDGLQLKDEAQYSDSVDAIVSCALAEGSKDATYWLDAYALSVDEKLNTRKAFLSKEYDDFIYYDDVYNFLDRLASNAFTHGRNKIDVEGNDWFFEKRSNLVLKKVESLFRGDDFQYVAPLDYQQKKEEYKWNTDFPVVKNAYDGYADKDSTVSINEGLQINAVLYDDVEQGRKPPQTLVSLIFGYALYIRQHNNTVAFQSEVDAIDTQQHFTSGGEWKHPDTFWISALEQYNEGKELYLKLTQEIRDSLQKGKEADSLLSPEQLEARQEELSDQIISEVLADEAKGLPVKHKFRVKR